MRKRLDYNLIANLYNTGLSAEQVAEKVGCSKFGVYGALKRSGVPTRKGEKRKDGVEAKLGFKPTKGWMRGLLKEHDCAASAANAVGISYSTFIGLMDRLGFDRTNWRGGPRGNTRRQDIPIEEAIRMSESGSSYAEIAEHFGVSYGVAAKRLRGAGYRPPVRTRKYDDRVLNAPYAHRKIIQEIGVFECMVCGETRGFDLCHIVPRSKRGPTVKENGLVLCPSHHRFFDNDLLTDEEARKIDSRVRAARRLFQ